MVNPDASIAKPDLEDDLEAIFAGIAVGPEGGYVPAKPKPAPAPRLTLRPPEDTLSGIAPAKDPVAELDDLEDDNETQSEVADLRTSIEDMKTHLAKALARADKLDRDLDDMCRHTQEARVYIRSALAIIHLQQHNPTSLSSNAMAGVFEALSNAAHDLEKAEIKADRIPF